MFSIRLAIASGVLAPAAAGVSHGDSKGQVGMFPNARGVLLNGTMICSDPPTRVSLQPALHNFEDGWEMCLHIYCEKKWQDWCSEGTWPSKAVDAELGRQVKVPAK